MHEDSNRRAACTSGFMKNPGPCTFSLSSSLINIQVDSRGGRVLVITLSQVPLLPVALSMSSERSGPAQPDVLDLPTLVERVFITCVYSLAVLLTIFRLVCRIRIRRLSWDDALATFAAAALVVFAALNWVWWDS
ncbi:hypothetical protein PM082_013995 [Marasmius tenuissimus]|nr:hypothetical protein PM082_013995 [Marasmius tenuissimus]